VKSSVTVSLLLVKKVRMGGWGLGVMIDDDEDDDDEEEEEEGEEEGEPCI